MNTQIEVLIFSIVCTVAGVFIGKYWGSGSHDSSILAIIHKEMKELEERILFKKDIVNHEEETKDLNNILLAHEMILTLKERVSKIEKEVFKTIETNVKQESTN